MEDASGYLQAFFAFISNFLYINIRNIMLSVQKLPKYSVVLSVSLPRLDAAVLLLFNSRGPSLVLLSPRMPVLHLGILVLAPP